MGSLVIESGRRTTVRQATPYVVLPHNLTTASLVEQNYEDYEASTSRTKLLLLGHQLLVEICIIANALQILVAESDARLSVKISLQSISIEIKEW